LRGCPDAEKTQPPWLARNALAEDSRARGRTGGTAEADNKGAPARAGRAGGGAEQRYSYDSRVLVGGYSPGAGAVRI